MSDAHDLTDAVALVRGVDIALRKIATTFRMSSVSARWVHARACVSRNSNVYRRVGNGTIRRGFTLVELLVVIFIMLAITAVTIPIISPSLKNRDVREAARMIDVFFNGARSRARATGHIYGVMIERMPGMPNGAVTLSYCEQPDAYTGDYASAVSFPGAPPGATGSTIRMLGNGGFGTWTVPPVAGNTVVDPTVLPMFDTGWIAGPAPPLPPATTGSGWLTNIAPGDVVTIKGIQYRIWAGEPFLDLNQDGICDQCTGIPPNTPGTASQPVQEPFIDVDGNGLWTPPNYPNSPFGFNAAQPYVDPNSGYFVQPNLAAISTGLGPFPMLVYGSTSAFVTYAPFDPVQEAATIGAAYQWMRGPNSGTPYVFSAQSVDVPPSALSLSFSFLRRPIKTSAPSIQLPGEAVIDLGANYFYSTQPPPNVLPIPGSGIEVLVANANSYGLWANFAPNATLDPSLPSTPASLPPNDPGYLPSDPTSIMITFQPNGTIDRVFSWSEINDGNGAMTTVNWSDWQGRIPPGPIYLLVGRQELLNGDPTMVPLMAEMADNSKPPLKPIYNVQDPAALWVVIDPRSGAVATAENVGFDLESPMIFKGSATSGAPFTQLFIYWNANVYYARRLARDMLDKGGR